MSQETTEARRLTLAAQEALAAAFPGTSFTVETGHITRAKGQAEVILRGEVTWINGPAVGYVQEVIHNLAPRYVSGNWHLICHRWYTPEWATSMAQHIGSRVKVSSYGLNREAALLHPHSTTPEAEEELRQFREKLDFCLAPQHHGQRRTDQ